MIERPSRSKESRQIEAKKAWQKFKEKRESTGWTPKKKGKVPNTERVRERRILRSAAYNARIRNVEFSLVLDDIIIPEFCPVLNFKIDINAKRDFNSPSIDRIDPNKGYIKGNVRIISWRANLIKSNMTLDECKLLLMDLEKIYDNSNKIQ